MKYHIHVYKVISLKEVNVEAKTEEKARKVAIKFSKNKFFNKPDCALIALSFDKEE